MAKAQNKTVETGDSVPAFIAGIKDSQRRADCKAIVDLARETTKFEPKMWGPAIIGFGSYHYKYESGREDDAPLMGLASRSNAIALYLSGSFDGREALLAKFGKHKAAKACLYIQSLADIDNDCCHIGVHSRLGIEWIGRSCPLRCCGTKFFVDLTTKGRFSSVSMHGPSVSYKCRIIEDWRLL